MNDDDYLKLIAEMNGDDPEKLRAKLDTPNWNATSGYEWELYIDYRIREIWAGLPLVGKLLAYSMAQNRIDDGRMMERD